MTRSRQADGIILMSHRLPFDVSRDDFSVSNLPPLVNGCEFIGIEGLPTIAIDDHQAAIDATTHLIDYGHRKIAVITGDMNTSSSRKRLEGFRDAMSGAGLDVNEQWLVYGEYCASCGETAANQLLVRKNRPTAIFCFSDEIAMGCMYSLRQHGFRVPEDISIIGFDDIPFAKYLAPSLTTVAQPQDEIGAACATILLDLIDGKKPEKLHNILPHELVIRESTRKL
jgi:LacI family repressor for deo operon, udp, cdd, tsx, nupC, and nupG